jgi:hypothetical protein
MRDSPRWFAVCCLTALLALYVIGAVSHGSLRHAVQTLPLWFPIVMGFRRHELARWSGLPCLIFWLVIMIFIWLFLLGWARIVSGHFSPMEIAMTMVVGAACVCGIRIAWHWRTTVRPSVAAVVLVLFAALQLLAFRISVLPSIANR